MVEEDPFTGGENRDYADELGWFKILQRGKKAYVNEMLRREEQGINPKPGDNKNRCDAISLEIIKIYYQIIISFLPKEFLQMEFQEFLECFVLEFQG